MVEVSTSILSVKKGEEAETCLALEKAKTNYFHIDVMDGQFVEKDTYQQMLEISSYLTRISNSPLDIHLMVQDVKKGIEDFSVFNPNLITFHYEACKDDKQVKEMIELIKKANARVGISIKPDTNIEKIYPFLPYIHVVLVMTVEPGKGGQTLLLDMVDKIKKLKACSEENNLEIEIEADGGINLRTAPAVVQAGTDIIVAGTAILAATDYRVIIEEFQKLK